MTNPKHARRTRQILLFSLGLFFPVNVITAGIVALSNHTMVIGADGRLIASGPNMGGQLGVGDVFTRRTFCPPLGNRIKGDFRKNGGWITMGLRYSGFRDVGCRGAAARRWENVPSGRHGQRLV
jgi:hypothetical protein